MITIDELAKLANVSKSTVSKALNNRPDVSAETKRKILELSRENNFTPNAFGKGLRSKITKNIGVIFTREKHPLLNNPFFSRVLEGIEAELALNEYDLVLNIIQGNKTNDLPRMIKERRVDGIILVGVFNDIFIDRIIDEKINVVQVDPKRTVKSFSQVFIDNEHGALLATQHLIDHGHKRIGFVSGDLQRLSFKQRLEGYRKALEHNNIEFDKKLLRCGGLEDGYNQFKSLLKTEKPTAIFSANDYNALLGYSAINDMGLKIPDDISIMGFDDIWSTSISKPPLSTIRVYKEELGSIGVRTLLRIINGELEGPVHVIMPIKLVNRESVRNIEISLENKNQMASE
jgi:LacI family transcriptional regulator